jgi:uncharacterized protein YegP (UPF0339 family)
MAGKFVLRSTGKGKYVFSLKASNGRTVLTSESYASERAALSGIESVRKNAGKGASYDRRKAKNGQSYFVLMASNLEAIGQSEMYASASSMRNGIASVKSNARSAKLENRTTKK